MTYIALHAEKWLYGSTRTELAHDERACFSDMLGRAAITGADPPGLIYYSNEEHLATQLQVPFDLLQRTLEKCKKYKKIKTNFLKSRNQFVLKIINWDKYQHVYMSQKAYRKRQKEQKEKQKQAVE